MKKKKDKQVFYYTDERNDDFSRIKIKTRCIDETFKFVRKNVVRRFASFLLYYFIAIPLVFIYEKLILRVKFVNRKAVKKYKKKSYFLYGNHTGYIDAFTPNLISFPHRNRIIVSPETVSIKGLRNIVQMLGAIPLPTEFRGMKKFVKAIEFYNKKSNITIYPEAHIWPYYNGVRAFTYSSFGYPVKLNAPVFAFFTAYTKPKGFLSCFRKANITVYVSNPIFADEGLSEQEKKKNICDKVYNFMLEKSKYSDYEVIEYICVKSNEKQENYD